MEQSQEQVDALLDMFGPEDLHTDLVPYITEGPMGRMLHHPFVIEVMYTEALNKRINRQYVAKKERLPKAIEAKDWSRYVYLHERPYRLDALKDVIFDHDVRDESVWPLIATVWTDSENIWQNLDDWRELWDLDAPGRLTVMDEDEHTALREFPEIVTIYRGVGHEHSIEGMSWTTDKAKAEWFARRFSKMEGREAIVVEGKVKRDHILAVFLGRNESEVVVFFEDVFDVKRLEYAAPISK